MRGTGRWNALNSTPIPMLSRCLQTTLRDSSYLTTSGFHTKEHRIDTIYQTNHGAPRSFTSTATLTLGTHDARTVLSPAPIPFSPASMLRGFVGVFVPPVYLPEGPLKRHTRDVTFEATRRLRTRDLLGRKVSFVGKIPKQ